MTQNAVTVKRDELEGEYTLWGEPTGERSKIPPGQYIVENNTYYLNFGGVRGDKDSWTNVKPINP